MNINVNNADMRMTVGNVKQLPRDTRPQIALSGRSNVGKSSLINTLLGRRSFARVSSAPGKTVTVNFFDIDGKLTFVDLPGYGYAKRSERERRIWSSLVDAYVTGDTVSCVVQLIDLKVGPTADDLMMLDWLRQTDTSFFVVATKADKLNRTEREKALAALATHPAIPTDTPIIPFSALKGEGKEEVWKIIFAHADIK